MWTIEVLGLLKRDPKIYAEVLLKLGVTADEMIFFDDAKNPLIVAS